ncbi:MAG: XRE family transcriptional regulator [Verrucomicrobia bacterium]|nr:XRE family transcriptional regulator [Verrucomicrobiota bacterium]
MPFCSLRIKAHYNRKSNYWKTIHGYPALPQTVGEHVRKRRLDLGLGQREAAARIGVHIETLKFWEHGVLKPAIATMPKVLAFLGTNPLPKPTTFAQRLVHHRICHGLRQEELAAHLRINPSTLGRWEAGYLPPPVRMREVEAMLAVKS